YWYNDHKYGIVHDGYWSFESGALVKVLGLDDSCLKGLPYYPYDMVHWNDIK
ncbi:PoNe immunity protein domain-containing protein, partial [Bacteroides caccae]